MFSRSVVASLRQATARPALRAAAPRAAAVRLYSAEAEKSAEGDKAAEKKNGDSDEAKKIAELEEKVKELTKEMQYMRADYQTLARRSAEERAKASDFAIQKFALALLQTSDVLHTALKHVPQPVEKGTPLGDFFGGVDLTRKQLLQTFDHHGVKPMDHPVGSQFDPNLHEATFQVPAEVAPKRESGEPREAGEVIDVSKEGWMIKDRVLRPAQVGVVQME